LPQRSCSGIADFTSISLATLIPMAIQTPTDSQGNPAIHRFVGGRMASG
jgi:hypothetical protein